MKNVSCLRFCLRRGCVILFALSNDKLRSSTLQISEPSAKANALLQCKAIDDKCDIKKVIQCKVRIGMSGVYRYTVCMTVALALVTGNLTSQPTKYADHSNRRVVSKKYSRDYSNYVSSLYSEMNSCERNNNNGRIN